MNFLERRALEKAQRRVSEYLDSGDEVLDFEQGIAGSGQRAFWAVSRRALFILDASARLTIRLSLADVTYLQGNEREITVTDSLDRQLRLVTPHGSRGIHRLLAQRLEALPAFQGRYSTADGLVTFSYRPWRPGVPASWRVLSPAVVDDAAIDRLFARVDADLFAAAEHGVDADNVALSELDDSDPRRLPEALMHALPDEELDAPFATGHAVGEGGRGQRRLIIAGDEALYLINRDPVSGHDLTRTDELDVPPPAVDGRLRYEALGDWEDWDPEPHGESFLFRLWVEPEASGGSRGAVALVGLPTSAEGLAVRDRVVRRILERNPGARSAASVLGRDARLAPHPVSWKQRLPASQPARP